MCYCATNIHKPQIKFVDHYITFTTIEWCFFSNFNIVKKEVLYFIYNILSNTIQQIDIDKGCI